MNGRMTRRDMLRRSAVTGVASCTLTGAALTLEACNAQQWIQIALNDLPTVLQIALAIINIVGAAQGGADPATIAKAQQLAAEVQTDLQTAQKLIADYKANAGTTLLSQINAAMLSAQTNLAGILQVLHVTNPTTEAEIAAAVSAAIAAVTYIESLIPTPAVTASAKLKSAQTSNAAYIKAAFNLAISAAGGSQYVIR